MHCCIYSTTRFTNPFFICIFKSFYSHGRVSLHARKWSGASLADIVGNFKTKVMACLQQNNCYASCTGNRFSQDRTTSNDKPNSTCTGKSGKWPSDKRISFKFHEELEQSVNEQINVEFKAYYHYLSMAAYFGRVDVALPGCESYFTQMYHEEFQHALRFLNYINMRGGKVCLHPVIPPDDQEWKCPLHAFQTALQLELEVSEKLTAVNSVAEKHNDLNAADFIVTGFMENQMKDINEIAKLVTVLSGVGDRALARFIFDNDLLDNYVTSEFNVLKHKKPK